MKKIISMVIVLSMIVSMIPGAAFAAEADNLCEHHAEHTAECGYVEGVSDCAYHCDVCLGHDHGDEVTEEDTEPAPVCDCGTDDGLIHATTCAVYVAPENPVCYCVEKCTEVNEWCDVCGFDVTGCTGTDTAAVYAVGTIDLSQYSEGATIDISEDSVIIGDGNEYKVSLNIAENATVTFDVGASGVKLGGQITVADGKTLTLLVAGDAEHTVNGGISLGNGSNVIIEGDLTKENNKLTVTATDGNAGIGANGGVTAGDITIRNARVDATGSSREAPEFSTPASISGAAIGTSAGSMGDILIENSIIFAEGGYYESTSHAPAIGIGYVGSTMGNITLKDSQITARNNGDGLASVIGAGANMHVDVTGTLGDIVITNTELNLSMEIGTTHHYAALIGSGVGKSYAYVNMGKIIFTDMKQEELDEVIPTWLPSDFNQYGAYALGIGYEGIVYKCGTFGGVWVSDGNGGTVQIGDESGYYINCNKSGFVHDFDEICGGTCSDCGVTYYVVHTMGTAATCTELAVCSVCGESYGDIDADAHSYGDWISNGDNTHTRTCANDNTHTDSDDCSGGTATCKEQAVCDICKTAYGELGAHTAEPTYAPNTEDSTKHDAAYSCCGATVTEAHTLDVTTGKCSACGADMTAIATVTDGTNTYYASDAATLNQAVTAILETGSRTFTVELPADAEAGMITAIRRAICDTEGVADGSIHLTLKGVTSIPGTTSWDAVAFGPRNAQWDENNVEIVSHEEVTQLASVNLPDVTEIGAQAFYLCSNLTSITAPKVQSIGDWGLQGTAITSIDMPLLKEARYSAFCSTALTEVSLPSLETAGVIVFGHCKQLRTVDLPKLQNLSQQLFTRCTSLVSVSAPAATSMGNNVFKGCSELVSITLPGVTELTYEAFSECTKLENITLGSVITSVNANLFGSDSSLSSNITLTLNCGQEKAETLPAAAGTNVEWAGFTWKEVKFAHSYVNSKCTACGEDCAHTGGTATCTTQAVCESCGASYGEVDTTNHDSSVECVNGFCPNGCYEPATLNAAGYYEIDNAGKLFWFAQQVNVEGNREIKGVLTADIDLENKPWTPIGETGENNNNFRGVFDGQGRTIKGLYVEGGRAGLGFFGEVRTGTVKNFTIYGNVVVNTEVDYVGGVIGSICGLNSTDHGLERNGAIIQNITSFVNVTAKAHGIGMIGGFVGYANHQSLIEQCAWYGTFDAGEYRVDSGAGGFIGKIQENTSEVTIRNCGAYGTIKTDYVKNSYNNTATIYMGGFLSFSNTNTQTTLENCLFAGKFERGANLTDQAFLGAFGTLRSVKAIKNCYYRGDDGLEAVHSDSLLKPGDNIEITSVTGEELKEGTVATQLGDLWEQDVHYPIPKDTKAHSDSATYTYTDNGDGTHKKTCNECGYVEVYNEAHSGGTATCTEQAVCQHCGASYGEVGGHSPDAAGYTVNADGTHSYTCSSCGNPFTESHTFTDGACTGCGVIGGYCGEEGNEQNVIWTYANGTLTISGTGAMADQFDNYNNRPWEEYVDQITTIVVNDGITSIGEAAFGRFQKLTTAKLPDSLTTISQQAFYGCTALKTVNFPANLKTIEGWAFLGCALESVTLPEGLTTIGYRAFSECKNLTSVTVPASVTTIDEGAFGYSPAKITVAEDNLNYSSDEHGVLFDKDKTTLIYCRPNIEVETYTIPSTVTEICKEAFYGCKNLATITIPDGVQKIGSSAFGSCEALTTITIPAGVTTIEANTFYDCTALTAVTIPAGVTTIDMWAFSGCTALTTVTIPASVTSIAYNAFSNCSALTTVNVPCTWDGSLYTFDESVTLNKVHNWVDGTCTACGAPCDHKDSTHTTSNNNGDGTHSFECSVCNTAVTEDHTATYSASGKVITESCSKCKADLGTATISAENATYNGTEQKTATVDYSEGWRGGELTVSYENNTNAGTATASITIGEATASVDFTIAKAPLTVTANDASITYGDAPKNNGVTYDGFVNGEDETVLGGVLNYSYSYTQYGNVGSYSITPQGLTSDNYEITFVDGTLTVEQKNATAASITLEQNSYVYDGTAKEPKVTSIIVDGRTLTEGTDYTVSYEDNINADNYAIVVIDFKGNYYGSLQHYFQITKAPLTVTADNKTMTTGQNLPTFTYTITGFVGGETEDVLTAKPTVSCEADGKTAGTYDITVSGAAADNYEITYVNGTLSVADHQHAWTYTAKDDTITATCNAEGCPDAEQSITISAVGKIYDGTPVTATLNGSIDGVATPEITYTGNTNAGTHTASITIEGETASVKFTIEKATVTVTADAKSKPYGTDNPTLTYTSEGLLGDDALTGALETTATKTSSVGEYDITVGSLANSNYTIDFVGAKLTITKAAAPAIAWPTAAELTYGQKLSDSTLTSEDENGTFAWQDGSIVPTVTNDGYVVVYTPKDTDNYDYSSVKLTETISVTVSKVSATVTAAPTPNTLTYTGEAQYLINAGEANGGTMQYSTDNQTWSTTISQGTDAGKYTVYYKVVGDENHSDTAVDSIEVTIAKADPVIGTVGCEMPLFDSTDISTVELTRTDMSVDGTLILTDSELTAGEGTYNWKFTPEDTDNYNTITGTVVLTVTADVLEQIRATGTLEKFSYVYGELFSIDGMTVTAIYTSGATKDVTGLVSFDRTLAVSQTAVELTYQGKICVIDGITVARKQLVISGMSWTVPTNAVFSGTAYTATLNGTLPEGVSVTKTGDKATNAGEYTAKAVFSLADGYSADNYEIVNGEDLTEAWSIAKKDIAGADVVLGDTLTYTGSEQTQTVTKVEIDGLTVTYTVSGNTGTDVGKYTLTVTGTGNYTGSVTKEWSIGKAAAVIATAPTENDLIYTGTAQNLVNAGSANGGTMVYSLSENGQYTATIPTGTNAGEYTVWYYVDGDDNHSDSAKTSVEVTIAKAKAVINVDTTPINVAYGEEVTLPTATTNFGQVSCDKTATNLVNAGTYTVTYSVAGTDNYEGAKKTLTVTVGQKSVAEPTVTGTYTYTGAEQTVVLTGVESYMTVAAGNKGTNAGNYEVEITLNSNYKWADDSDGKVQWSIAKAQAEIRVNTDPITVTYGETVTLPTATTNFGSVVCSKTADDLVNAGTYTVAYTVAGTDNYAGDTKTLTVTVGQKTVTEPAITGTYTYTGAEQTVVLAGVESCMTIVSGNKGTDVDNYEVEVTLDGNHKWAEGSDGKVQWSIVKAQAEISVNTDPITVIYGEEVTLPTATTNFGTVSCDMTTADLVNVGSYTVTYTVAGTANYAGDTETVTVTINPKAITADDVELKGTLTYTGEEQTQEITVTEGIIYEVTGNKATNVGTYTLTVTASGNYTGSATKEWSIGKVAAAIATTPEANTLTYNGEAQVLVKGGTSNDGKVVYSLTEDGQYTEIIPTGTNADEYTVWYYVVGDANHSDSAKTSVTSVISKAELTITAMNHTITYGDAPAANGVEYSGFVNAESETVLAGTLAYGFNYEQYGDVGTYKITPSGVTSGNYEIAFVSGDLSVTAKGLSVKAEAKTKIYGETDPELTYQVDGLVGGDALTGTLERTSGENVGAYAIKQGTLTAGGNYTITYTGAALTINPKAITEADVELKGTLTYNGSEQIQQITGKNGITCDVTGNKANDVGTYELTVTGNGNYTGEVKLSYTVAKKPISVVWENTNLVYNGSAQSPVAKLAGVVTGDDVQAVVNGSGTNAGTYDATVSLTGTDAGNYALTGSTKFTIARAPVTFKVSNNSVEEGKTIAVTVISEPAGVGHTVTYRQNGDVVTPSAVGEYDIYVEITDSNYRHAASANGNAIKIGVLTIYEGKKPATYTLSYAPGEGSGTMAAEEAALAGTIRILPECTFTAPKDSNNNDMLFVGWTDGNATYKAGEQYRQPEKNVTMTALWVVEEHNISGMVKQFVSLDSTDLVNRGGVVVTLMLGSKQVAQAVTDANGNYKFEHCLLGTYNLVAEYEGIRQTAKAVLGHSDMSDLEIDLPAGKTNSTVDVEPGTPDVVVGGLDEMMKTTDDKVFTEEDKEVVEQGGEVEIKMEVKENPAPEKKDDLEKKAEEISTVTEIGIFIDLDLTKTVTEAAETTGTTTTIAEASKLLENIIFLPGHLQGKNVYHVFRDHGGQIEEMTELHAVPTGNNEGFIVDRVNHTITIYSMKYSTYAIAYTDPFTITFNANGGQVDVESAKTGTDGTLESLPTPTRSGYTFKGWFTAESGGTEVTTETEFNADKIIYAQWQMNYVPTPSGGDTNKVTVESSENGSVDADLNNAKEGTTVIITVVPDEGYVLDKLTVTDAKGNELKVTSRGNDRYSFVMPDSKVTIEASFVLKGADCTGGDGCLSEQFSDLDTSLWYHKATDYVLSKGLMNGVGGGKFDPNGTTSRAMIVTILWRLEGEPVVNYLMRFEDVAAETWYTEAVRWAASEGIVTGYSDLAFGPNDAITREQLATILYRYEQYKGGGFTGAWMFLLDFADRDKVSDWAYEAMCWTTMHGVINGKGDGILDPKGNAKRCEAAQMLMNYLNK